MADSLFRQIGSVVATAINTEKTQRTAAITTEIADRQNGDATLQTAINNEASVRQAADAGLSNTIGALDTAYKAADAALQTSINGKLDLNATAADSTKLAGIDASGYIRYYQQANAPVAATDGSIWKDTDTGLLYMAANDSGVLTWIGM